MPYIDWKNGDPKRPSPKPGACPMPGRAARRKVAVKRASRRSELGLALWQVFGSSEGWALSLLRIVKALLRMQIVLKSCEWHKNIDSIVNEVVVLLLLLLLVLLLWLLLLLLLTLSQTVLQNCEVFGLLGNIPRRD